jgi:hypothetical protein
VRETEHVCVCMRVCEIEIEKERKTEKERIDSEYLTAVET